MRALGRAGFTLAELVVALSLTAVVTAALLRLLSAAQRAYGEQVARAGLHQTLREAVAVLAGELREITPGDILALEPAAVAFHAARNIHFLCRPPDASRMRVMLAARPAPGLQPLEPARQAFWVLADDPDAPTTGSWLQVELSNPTASAGCPGGAPGLEVSVSGLTSGRLSRVRSGAPLRGYQPTRFELYRAADGTAWLGERTADGRGGWTVVQPVTGPLAPRGLLFTYFDRAGAVTATPGQVVRIGVTITATTVPTFRRGGSEPRPLTAHLSTHIALRNAGPPP